MSSTSETGPAAGPVTLDQFIALNDELAALIRAGVPLERGLVDAGRDLRGRLGAVSSELGRRMEGGMGLPEAVAASAGRMPELYRAVVEAGIRSGRLSQALEGMAAIARGYAEARRVIGMALLYPLVVFVLAYALAVFFLIQVAPRFASAFGVLRIEPLRVLGWLDRAGDSAAYWAPVPPILLGLLALRWAWAGRAVVMDRRPSGPILNRLPVVGSMIASYQAANFAGLLALLVEHRVPLDAAVRLAGEASGDRDLRAGSARFAEALRAGGTPDGSPAVFPPLLSWMLTAGHRQGDLPRSLGHLAENYRRRARGRADLLRLAMPAACLLVIGVGAVFLYALMLFVPLIHLLNDLALPTNR